MLTLPANLVPQFVEIAQLPAIQRAEGWPNDGIAETSIQLGEVPQRGTLDLIFANYPTQARVRTDYAHDIDRNGNLCGLNQAGWVGAWAFYRSTKDGHLAFTIPNDHKLWEFVDFKDEWLQRGLDGLPAIYRIIERPVPKFTDRLKQRCGFTLRIRQSLRTPRNF